jgi:hypothetical protein
MINLNLKQNSINGAIFSFPYIWILMTWILYEFDVKSYWAFFDSGDSGIIEWVQFICYIIAAFIGYKTFKFLPSQTIEKKIIFIFWICCFLIAMEEISWGWHIFKYPVNEVFLSFNAQGETNLHNNVLVNNKVPILYIIITLYAIGVRGLKKIFNESLFEYVHIDKSLKMYFIPAGVFYFYFLYINPMVGADYVITNHQENFETLLSMGFLLLAARNLIAAKKLRNMKFKFWR